MIKCPLKKWAQHLRKKMIHEVIVTTSSKDNIVHIAPMGIKVDEKQVIISPFRPSKTLENLTNTKKAVVNFIDDVRVFAGIVTGYKKEWPLIKKNDDGIPRLELANTHYEVVVEKIIDNEKRPKIICNIVKEEIHYPFMGFNRAQFSVIEAAVLVSRLGMISMEKITDEIKYLKIGIEKTSGPRELEAWQWIEDKIENFKLNDN